VKVEGESRIRVLAVHKYDPSREMIVAILAFDEPSETTKLRE
jgi:hypothetical protein